MDLTPEKWSRIKLLFDEALQLSREARSAYLAQNCTEEERHSVEKLLAGHEDASGFLATSYPVRATASLLNQRPLFSPGDVLTERFRITRMIARGGMGEVYEAEDQELPQTRVAIKTIRPDFLQNPRSLDRFKREVLLAKQVTHQNICRVFDLFRHRAPRSGEFRSDDIYFVTMELLRGETLAERLQRCGRMTTDQALPLVLQMAAALGAAHAAGILHRDFKPGNVVLVPLKNEEARVVVTDFGLAVSRPSGDFSATLTLTVQNEALGTPAYMSPEQFEDRPVTSASDIYSFGLVIYEMVTGARPFEGQTPISIALKRLTEPPPSPRNSVPDLDSTWDKVILKCVAREPSKRYEKPEQVVEALTNAERVSAERKPGHLGRRFLDGAMRLWREPLPRFRSFSRSARPWPRTFLMASVAFFVLVVGAIKFHPWLSPTLVVGHATQITSDGRQKGGRDLLADHEHVYFPEAVTEGLILASVAVEGGVTSIVPFSLDHVSLYDLSPARSELLIGRRAPNGETKLDDLWIAPLFGGPPRRVGTIRVRAATFSADRRKIAFISGLELFICSADGTETRKIANVPDRAVELRWSPDGSRLRFSSSLYVNGAVQDSLWEVAADGTNLHQLLVGWQAEARECCGTWTPDGKFFVFQAFQNGHSVLWAMPERHTWLGRQTSTPIQLTSEQLDFSDPVISLDGKHLFAVGDKQQGELVRYDVTRHDFVPFLGGVSATWVTFSKSGRWVAYTDYPSRTLWRANSDGTQTKQITFAPLEVDGYSWSPDEKWFAVRARNPSTTWRIYLIPSEGGVPQPLMPGEMEQGIPGWSPDSTRLCFGDVAPNFGEPTGAELIHLFDLRTHSLTDLPQSHLLWTSRWSPDGRYISALTATDQRLVLFDFTKNAWHSTDALAVNNPNWSSDSKYIYYDTEGADRALRKLRISDGKVEELKSLRAYPNLTPSWSGLSPDNSPLLLRSLVHPEVYSIPIEYR